MVHGEHNDDQQGLERWSSLKVDKVSNNTIYGDESESTGGNARCIKKARSRGNEKRPLV